MMKNIKIVRLQYAVKIDVDNNYSIYPHNCLKASYDNEEDKNIINIKTIGKNKLILSFNKEELIDIYYKDKNTDIVEYINKLL